MAHRGSTTCIDIQNMPPGTRVHIEVNENNMSCSIPESVIFVSYLDLIARDPVLAPISFPDWRTKGMQPFKKKNVNWSGVKVCIFWTHT
ncbi:hypothetical protein KFK09_004032 [Dendrobium nobile]|uniref:Uncharacterized protein n=1 Tax=Dendrobium nobile TaxID=94219 RepID=A0A8T3C1T7_DENNO|nr:hypothetical protein KFK09_004032 [Dendrobium nobile]